ncbi:homeobox-domain-containing protein [Thelephora ganbajun]|uniref:Homeobox-domain-containing protein n=1 Tax=Thelephora ganbajun TaxID=370292 RepID=A0ACB6ZLR2_THEGA|nr:homeobox-domain-containing protein [Thelephora ganbajun]
MNPALSRTSSVASVTSDDAATPTVPGNEVKRTRKRFTQAQIVKLEQLFHETSHPTREQRENLANECDLELRSVTVWFQNKRQTERKSALTSTSTTSGLPFSNSQPSSSLTRPKIGSSSTSSNRHSHSRLRTQSLTGRPSLDDVASRSEYRAQPPTPPRKSLPSSSPGYALWENMPSSPIEPPSNSPETTRVFVEFGRKGKLRRTKTLEWACAAARLSDRKSHHRKEERDDLDHLNLGLVDDDGGDTEPDEDHEAVTPFHSFRRERVNSTPSVMSEDRQETPRKDSAGKSKANHDEETMNAALVLCGLRQ